MDLFKRATELLAALAAAVAFVYVLGAGIIWIRLWREGLPEDAVITSLPREVLLSVGLRSIFIPMLTFAAFAAAVFAFLAWSPLGAEAPDEAADAPVTVRSALKAVLGATSAVIGVIVALLLWLVNVAGDVSLLYIFGWAIGASVVLAATVVLASLWRHRLTAPKTLVAAALVIAVVATVVRLGVELVDPQFEDVAVCVKDSTTPREGLFVGETDRGIYVVPQREDRVIEIPRDRLTEVWIGSGFSVRCPRPAGG